MQLDKLSNYEVINTYKNYVCEFLGDVFPDIPKSELDLAIDYSITKRMKNGKAYINNNYKNVKIETTILDLAEYILDREPVITAYGVMFKKEFEAENPITKMVQGFLAQRKIYKKEMFKYPRGSEMYEKYNLLQLLAKIDAKISVGVR